MRPVWAAAFVLLASGCGALGTGGGVSDETVSLLLDFTPNAVHTGIYTARARDFDTGEGVQLRIRPPSTSTDAVRLLAAGRVDLAVLDIHDLGLARERGADIVGVMAIVQRPLAAVIARPGIESPAELEGRTVGVTGLPSDDAVLASAVRGAGGNPGAVRKVTIGFDAVRSLLTGRVDAATAFWNVEGVTLQRRRPGFRVFRIDELGAPAYPELVLATSRDTLRERGDVIRATVAALKRGYEQVREDPETSVAELVSRVRGLDRELVEAQLEAVDGAFTGPEQQVGVLSRERLEAWARFDVEFGILEERPDLDRAFAFDVANG